MCVGRERGVKMRNVKNRNGRHRYREMCVTHKKTIIVLTVVIAVLIFLPFSGFSTMDLKEGDLIFQETESEQARALRAATGSRWTHVGVFFRYNGKPFVFEAVQPVRITPLNVFLQRSWQGRFAVKRLLNRERLLTKCNITRLKKAAQRFLGRDYDIQFRWSDQRMYCSEVLWKLFNRVLGVKIGQLKRFRDYKLNLPLVRKLLNNRFGQQVPLDEFVIGPGDMYISPFLELIYRSW